MERRITCQERAERPHAVRRRDFLLRACDLGRIGFVGLVTARWPAWGARAAEHEIMLDKVTVADFAQYLGTIFRVRSESGRVSLELIEALPLGPRKNAPSPSNRREPFSLLFRGPAEPVLPQQIHAIEHARLGRIELFLVPIGPDNNGMRYEAVFN